MIFSNISLIIPSDNQEWTNQEKINPTELQYETPRIFILLG